MKKNFHPVTFTLFYILFRMFYILPLSYLLLYCHHATNYFCFTFFTDCSLTFWRPFLMEEIHFNISSVRGIIKFTTYLVPA